MRSSLDSLVFLTIPYDCAFCWLFCFRICGIIFVFLNGGDLTWTDNGCFTPALSYCFSWICGTSSGLLSVYTECWRGIILKNRAGSDGVATEDNLSKAKKMRKEKELNPKKIYLFEKSLEEKTRNIIGDHYQYSLYFNIMITGLYGALCCY